MKGLDWLTPAFLSLCCGTAALYAEGRAMAPQNAERIKIQEARIPQIEAIAVREREQVERWYQERRTAIFQDVARQEAARLSRTQRELWVQYADLYLGRSYAAGYFLPSSIPSLRSALLEQAMVQEYLISAMADVLADKAFERKLTHLVEERLEIPQLRILRDQAAEFLIVVRRVQAQLAIEGTQLENQKKARLDTIMQQERDLKEQVRHILEYLRQGQTQLGVVASVGYCPTSGYFCMVEGVDRVLHVGDRVGRVRVVKIDQQKVEFAKDGTTWTQMLGAAPQPFWD